MFARRCFWLAAPVAALSFTPVGQAQDTGDSDLELERLEREVALLKAETELATSKLAQAKLVLDQLPEFEGNATTDASTGKLQASILSLAALSTVIESLTGSRGAFEMGKQPHKILILTGDETIPFGSTFPIAREMQALHHALPPAVSRPVMDCGAESLTGLGVPGVIAGLSALAGLLRSDVTHTSIDVDAVTSDMAGAALAAKLNERDNVHAFRSSDAFVQTPELEAACGFDDLEEWEDSAEIGSKYVWLLAARVKAKATMLSLSDTKADKKKKAALEAWIKEFDAFNARVSTPAKDAPAPLVAAMRADALTKNTSGIVRVQVNTAAGGLTNSKNLGTFFGVDPLRVHGGLILSYSRYTIQPNGLVKQTHWGSWACTSDQIRLDQVRAVSFQTPATPTSPPRDNVNVCWNVAAFGNVAPPLQSP